MVGVAEVLTGGVLLSTVAIAGGGYLARRDKSQQDDIDANKEAIQEMDTAFGQLVTRLFGHPQDVSDDGALPERARRIDEAESDLAELERDVRQAVELAEENNDAIDRLEDRVTTHAGETQDALGRIEEHLDVATDLTSRQEQEQYGGDLS